MGGESGIPQKIFKPHSQISRPGMQIICSLACIYLYYFYDDFKFLLKI